MMPCIVMALLNFFHDRTSKNGPSGHKLYLITKHQLTILDSVQYVHWCSISFKVLLIILSIDGRKVMLIPCTDQWLWYNKLEKYCQILCAHLIHFRWPSHFFHLLKCCVFHTEQAERSALIDMCMYHILCS